MAGRSKVNLGMFYVKGLDEESVVHTYDDEQMSENSDFDNNRVNLNSEPAPLVREHEPVNKEVPEIVISSDSEVEPITNTIVTAIPVDRSFVRPVKEESPPVDESEPAVDPLRQEANRLREHVLKSSDPALLHIQQQIDLMSERILDKERQVNKHKFICKILN